MSRDSAATRIQSLVRGSLVRRRCSALALEQTLSLLDLKEESDAVRGRRVPARKQSSGLADESMGSLESGEPLTLDFMRGMLDRFRAKDRLDVESFERIVKAAIRVLGDENNVVDVRVPPGKAMVVVGDLHGQIADLLHIFSIKGLPSPDNMYIFNGDFVDRGDDSCEVLAVVFGFKVLYPSAVFLNRGNHESGEMTESMGFMDECKAKYEENEDDYIYNLCLTAFSLLPLATVVNNDVFVVHGGVPGYWKRNSDCSEDGPPSKPYQFVSGSLSDIRSFYRIGHKDNPYSTMAEGLLWSDPSDYGHSEIPRLSAGGSPPDKRRLCGYIDHKGMFHGHYPNITRRYAGCMFGSDVLADFLRENGFSTMIRSHEVKMDGFEVSLANRCLTVFSASNYQGYHMNKGAVVLLTPDSQRVKTKRGRGRVVGRSGTGDAAQLSVQLDGSGETHSCAAVGTWSVLNCTHETYMADDGKGVAGAGRFCLRTVKRQENAVLSQLVRHISVMRLHLLEYYNKRRAVGIEGSIVTRQVWARGLRHAFGVPIPFLLHMFQDMLGLPRLGVNNEPRGPIDYQAFLRQFTPAMRPSAAPRGNGPASADEHALNRILLVLLKYGVRIQTLFSYLDADGNGIISPQEFIQGILHFSNTYKLGLSSADANLLLRLVRDGGDAKRAPDRNATKGAKVMAVWEQAGSDSRSSDSSSSSESSDRPDEKGVCYERFLDVITVASPKLAKLLSQETAARLSKVRRWRRRRKRRKRHRGKRSRVLPLQRRSHSTGLVVELPPDSGDALALAPFRRSQSLGRVIESPPQGVGLGPPRLMRSTSLESAVSTSSWDGPSPSRFLPGLKSMAALESGTNEPPRKRARGTDREAEVRLRE